MGRQSSGPTAAGEESQNVVNSHQADLGRLEICVQLTLGRRPPRAKHCPNYASARAHTHRHSKANPPIPATLRYLGTGTPSLPNPAYAGGIPAGCSFPRGKDMDGSPVALHDPPPGRGTGPPWQRAPGGTEGLAAAWVEEPGHKRQPRRPDWPGRSLSAGPEPGLGEEMQRLLPETHTLTMGALRLSAQKPRVPSSVRTSQACGEERAGTSAGRQIPDRQENARKEERAREEEDWERQRVNLELACSPPRVLPARSSRSRGKGSGPHFPGPGSEDAARGRPPLLAERPGSPGRVRARGSPSLDFRRGRWTETWATGMERHHS